MISNWLRAIVSAMFGGATGGTLVWHYSGDAFATLIGSLVGFAIGWAFYAPVSLLRAIPVAWHKTKGWRMNEAQQAFWVATVVFWLVPIIGFVSDVEAEITVAVISAVLFTVWISGLCIAALLFCVSESTSAALKKELDEAEDFAKKVNFFTVPFWVLYGIYRLALLIPTFVREVAKVVAASPSWSARQASAFGRFLVRFIGAVARLTSENGRLVAGGSAAIGIICGRIWHQDPLIMGALAGLLASATCLASSLALRILPLAESKQVEI